MGKTNYLYLKLMEKNEIGELPSNSNSKNGIMINYVLVVTQNRIIRRYSK
jgi:hypothetical protein